MDAISIIEGWHYYSDNTRRGDTRRVAGEQTCFKLSVLKSMGEVMFRGKEPHLQLIFFPHDGKVIFTPPFETSERCLENLYERVRENLWEYCERS